MSAKLKLTSDQLEELRKWEDETFCKAAVAQDGDALQYVRTQTPEIVAIALKQSQGAWRYIAKTIYDTVTVEPPPQPEPAPKRCDKCGHTIEE